jgi:ATP synthase protein I
MTVDQAHSGEIPTESAPPSGGVSGASTTATEAAKRPAVSAPSAATSTSDRVAAATRATVTSLKLSSVGIEFALSVLIGVFAGRWLDGKLGSSPWLMILCLCLGFAAGLRSLIRAMDKAGRAADKAEAGARPIESEELEAAKSDSPESSNRRPGGGVL